MKRIGLLSDTHSFVDPDIFKFFQDCDEIWHAGDIGSLEVVDKLGSFKPLAQFMGTLTTPPSGTAFRKTCGSPAKGLLF